MNSELYVGDGNVLINGSPRAIAVHLAAPVSATRAGTVLASHLSHLDDCGRMLGLLDHYENVDKVSIGDLTAVAKSFEDIVPESINIRSFTTKPTVNNYDVFIGLLHKKAGALEQAQGTVEDMKALHQTLYGDVDMFMVMRYYLNSVENWMQTAPDISDMFIPTESVVNAVDHLYDDETATMENAVDLMLSPYFTSTLEHKSDNAKNKMHNVFESNTSDLHEVTRAHEHIQSTKRDIQALLLVYKHWYDAAGKITSLS